MQTILKKGNIWYNTRGGKDIQYRNYGSLWLVLDDGEFYEGGTPAMVYHVDRKGHIIDSATFTAAWNESAVDYYELTDGQWKWLDSMNNIVEKYYEKHGKSY